MIMTIAQWIDLLMGLILIVTVLSSGFRRLNHLVRCWILQSLALSLVLALKGVESGEYHLLIAAVLTMLIKAVFIPYVMYRVINTLKVKREIEPFVPIPFSMIFSGLLVYLSYFMTSLIPGELGELARDLPIAISLILIGIFLMITRSKAITQMVGFLILENGIFIIEMGISGMGMLIEVGILFELMIGAIVMGIMMFNINKTFDTVNTSKLTTLKE